MVINDGRHRDEEVEGLSTRLEIIVQEMKKRRGIELLFKGREAVKRPNVEKME